MLVGAHRQARPVTVTAHAQRTRTDEPADAGQYSLRLLRGFELRCDDELVVLSMSAQRLAAFLALHDRAMQRVHIAGNLWIDSTEARRTQAWRPRPCGCHARGRRWLTERAHTSPSPGSCRSTCSKRRSERSESFGAIHRIMKTSPGSQTRASSCPTGTTIGSCSSESVCGSSAFTHWSA